MNRSLLAFTKIFFRASATVSLSLLRMIKTTKSILEIFSLSKNTRNNVQDTKNSPYAGVKLFMTFCVTFFTSSKPMAAFCFSKALLMFATADEPLKEKEF